MLAKALSLLLNLLPAQVCGTNDLTHIYLEDSETCQSGHNHLCWAGEWPTPWTAVACCNGAGLCHLDPDGVCRLPARAVCRIPV